MHKKLCLTCLSLMYCITYVYQYKNILLRYKLIRYRELIFSNLNFIVKRPQQKVDFSFFSIFCHLRPAPWRKDRQIYRDTYYLCNKQKTMENIIISFIYRIIDKYK